MKGLLEANEQSQAEPGRSDYTKQDRKLQVGIDSFASQFVHHGAGDEASASNGIRHLVERIELADQVSLDVFGVGEHHARNFWIPRRRSFSRRAPPGRNTSGSRVPSPC